MQRAVTNPDGKILNLAGSGYRELPERTEKTGDLFSDLWGRGDKVISSHTLKHLPDCPVRGVSRLSGLLPTHKLYTDNA